MKVLIDLGSHEFYSHRAEITKRLIQDKVFEIFLKPQIFRNLIIRVLQ